MKRLLEMRAFIAFFNLLEAAERDSVIDGEMVVQG